MTDGNVHPTTLTGIKRLAKTIKAQESLTHSKALDEAARRGGYQNFQHAHHSLHAATPLPPAPLVLQADGFDTYLSMAWRDRDTGASGQEILRVRLSSPWATLIRPAQFDHNRGLSGLKDAGSDHLAWWRAASAKDHARSMLRRAARTLQFIDATKLRPSSGSSGRVWESRHPLPGVDHGSLWFDPETRRYLYANEPYEAAAKSRAEERAEWSARFGIEVARPDWPGMYTPEGRSQLYLVSHATKGIPLAPLVAALNRIPPLPVAGEWEGHSLPSLPVFISPGATVAPPPPLRRRLLPAEGSASLGKSVRYQPILGPASRRPDARMPVDSHAEVGQLLKRARALAWRRDGVANRIDRVRHELDEWVALEYPSEQELPQLRFLDLYYGDMPPDSKASTSAVKESVSHDIARAQEVLRNSYPPCAPLRGLLKTLEGAAASLNRWAA